MEKVGYNGGFGLANDTDAELTTNCPGRNVIFTYNGIPLIDGPTRFRKK